MAGILKRFHQAKLVFGKHAGENGKIVRPDLIGNLTGQAKGPGEADRLGDEGGRRGRISGHHKGADPERPQLLDHGLRAAARWIAQRHHSGEVHVFVSSDRDPENPVAAPFQFVGHQFRSRRGL